MRHHPKFVVGERVVVIGAPAWNAYGTFGGAEGIVFEVITNTLRLDYIKVAFKSGTGYHDDCIYHFTPYELRPTDPVRALAMLADEWGTTSAPTTCLDTRSVEGLAR